MLKQHATIPGKLATTLSFLLFLFATIALISCNGSSSSNSTTVGGSVFAPAGSNAAAASRLSRDVQVQIETRFIVVEEDFLRDVGVDFRGLGLIGEGFTQIDGTYMIEVPRSNSVLKVMLTDVEPLEALFIPDSEFVPRDISSESTLTAEAVRQDVEENVYDVQLITNDFLALYEDVAQEYIVNSFGDLFEIDFEQVTLLSDDDLDVIARALRQDRSSEIALLVNPTVFPSANVPLQPTVPITETIDFTQPPPDFTQPITPTVDIIQPTEPIDEAEETVIVEEPTIIEEPVIIALTGTYASISGNCGLNQNIVINDLGNGTATVDGFPGNNLLTGIVTDQRIITLENVVILGVSDHGCVITLNLNTGQISTICTRSDGATCSHQSG